MKDILIVDAGRSSCRFHYNGNEIEFPAVVGRGKDFEQQTRKGLDALSVMIDSDHYLVGQLAIDESPSARTAREADKTESNNTLIQIATGAAYLLPQNWKGTLVVNFNVRDYSKNRDKFAEFLTRKFSVVFTYGDMHGTIKDFEFTNVQVLPEGLGAMYSLVYNNDLEVVRPDLTADDANVALIDIGSQTINLVAFKGFKWIERFSWAWDKGMHVPENELLRKLSSEYEYQPSHSQLADIFERKEVKIGRITHSLLTDVDLILEEYSESIRNEIDVTMPLSERKTITTVILSGGGSRCMIPYLKKHWPNAEVEVHPMVRKANLDGQRKIAMLMSK